MANANGSIDEIIGQEARNQVQETTNLLKLMVDEFKVAVTQAKTLNTEISNAKGLAQMTTALEKMNITTAKATEATNKAAVAYEKLRQQEQITATKLEQTATQQAKTDKEKVNIEKAKLDLRLKEDAAAQKAIANLAKETKAAEIQASAYIKLRDAHKLAEKVALEAGVTYGKNSEQFKLAAAESNKLRDQFVGLHKELGNNRDNVGNYGSALTKIWGGIRQIAYILPGLGIAGIFNLAGEAVIALASNIIDFNTALSESDKELMKIREQSQKTISDEVSKSKVLLDIAVNTNLRYNEREQAYKKLQQMYPDYLQNMSTEEALGGDLILAYEGISLAIERTAKKRAMYSALEAELSKESQLQAKVDLMNRASNGKSFLYYNQAQKEQAEGNLSVQKELVSELRNQILTQDEIEKGAFAINDEVRKAQQLSYLKGGKDKKPTATKPVNRIDDIKKQMDDEIAVAKVKASEEYKTENELRQDILEIYKKYATEKLKAVKNLNKDEEHSSKQLKEQILKDTQSIVEKQTAEINKQIKNDIDQHNRALKLKIKNNSERVKDEEKASADIIKANKDKNDKILADEKAAAEKKKAYLEAYLEIYQAALDIIGSISDGLTAKEMQRLDAKDKALKFYYDNELRFIENSGFSNEQKEKKKAKLAAETEAKQKQIDKERVTALRKQAALNKALSIVSIIAKTAEGIMAALLIPFYGEIKAAAIAATGAAELAAVIATPLPQYAKGRKGGKAEHAIVGEIGQEAIVTTDGKVTLTPSTPSLAYIPQGADVIPHNELIKNSAYVALARQGTVTTDKLQMALIAEFERNTEKIDELISVTKSKNLTATYNGLGAFESYKQANIR